MEKTKEQKRVECKECGSHFVYIRIKDKECVCRKCGHIQKLDK